MLTERFIYLHLPRTGGTTLRTLFRDIPDNHIYSGIAHVPHQRFVEICRREKIAVPPAFIFVRNPWAWYVSFWDWATSEGDKGRGDMTFSQYMTRTRFSVLQKTTGHKGYLLYSAMDDYWEYLQGDRTQLVGRFEDYENEVVRILVTLANDKVNEAWIRATLARVGRRRPSRKTAGPYQEYYTKETRQWVARWATNIIERFGYEF